MNAIRRTAALIGLVATVVIGSSIPASATFSASAAATSSVATATVDAPRAISFTMTCVDGARLAKLSWTASATQRIDRYVIDLVLPDQTQQFTAAADATTAEHSIPAKMLLPRTPVTATVTTVTQYGWTKTSSSVTAVWTC